MPTWSAATGAASATSGPNTAATSSTGSGISLMPRTGENRTGRIVKFVFKLSGQLLDSVWGNDRSVTQRSVDVYIRRIREKIEAAPQNPAYVQTVHGVGYKVA